MKTWIHVVSSLILAALFYPLFNWKVSLILVSGILIDIDHYFWYIYKYKNFSLLKCYRYFIATMNKDRLFENLGALVIFHTIEFLLVMMLLSLYNKLALIFTIGLLSHYLLDLIWYFNVPKRIIASTSIISWIIHNTGENQ